jgi:hypothetical protein
VKRYVEERGSQVLDEIIEGKAGEESLAISTFTVLELKSAFMRLVKGGRLGGANYCASSARMGHFG